MEPIYENENGGSSSRRWTEFEELRLHMTVYNSTRGRSSASHCLKRTAVPALENSAEFLEDYTFNLALETPTLAQ